MRGFVIVPLQRDSALADLQKCIDVKNRIRYIIYRIADTVDFLVNLRPLLIPYPAQQSPLHSKPMVALLQSARKVTFSSQKGICVHSV
jgi:hypothetical protein